MSWQERANCLDLDPDLFFPSSPSPLVNRRLVSEAKAVCSGCEVKAQCLAFARRNHERFGVWGQHDFEQTQRAHRTAIVVRSRQRTA